MSGFGFTGHRRLKTGAVIPYKCYLPNCKRYASYIRNGRHFCVSHIKILPVKEETSSYLDAVKREDKRKEEANEKAFEELRRIREEAF